MRKIWATILSICALTVFATPRTAVSAVCEFPYAQAKAETQNSNATKPKKTVNGLLSPNAYEQYLSLNAPTDVAVSENYTAIADGNIIYVYSRLTQRYYQYTHGENAFQSRVTKLQFDSQEKLYFLDAATTLYTLDPMQLSDENTQATKTELVCSTFAIYGDRLYYTNTSGNKSQISYAPLTSLTFTSSTLLVDNLTLIPVLAFYKNELYYTNSGQYLYKVGTSDGSNNTFLTAFSKKLLALSIIDGTLYCVTEDGTFSAYGLTALTENKQADQVPTIEQQTGDYASICLYGEHAYLLKGASILQYSLTDAQFTDYEITGASTSVNRLKGATDVTIHDDKLYLSDNGNERISVFDLQEEKFLQPISAGIAAKYVAADENTVLIASATEAILYDANGNNYGEQLSVSERINGNFVGVANVYGSYYFATDKNYFYTLSQNESNVWEWKSAQKVSTQYPSLFTADIYGNLYVACDSNVYIYNEENFTTSTVSTHAVITTLPENAEKIQTDYRGNLYALVDDNLHVFSKLISEDGKYIANGTTSLKEALSYNGNSGVQSFTISMTDNATYVLHEGHFLSVTDKMHLPALGNIATENAEEQIFGGEQTAFTILQTKPNTLFVEFNLGDLSDASVFPYLSYKRNNAPITALKIGKIDVYNLIAVHDENTAKYKTYLVYSTSCEEYEMDEYQIVYTETEQRIGYLSNAANLYRAPTANALFKNTALKRNEAVKILGEITKLDRAYYHVSYQTADGKTVMGYIPQSYITPTAGDTTSEILTLGGTDTRTDAYGRLIYILLGTATICGLIDYLILRKPKDDEEQAEQTQNEENTN